MKKGRKTNVELINEAVWYKNIYPREYALSISNEKLVFTVDFINVSAVDQMVAAVSKSELPKTLILSHNSSKVLNGCVDWLIKYCELFGKLLPEFRATNPRIFDRLEVYRKEQIKLNKRRRKKKRYV